MNVASVIVLMLWLMVGAGIVAEATDTGEWAEPGEGVAMGLLLWVPLSLWVWPDVLMRARGLPDREVAVAWFVTVAAGTATVAYFVATV